MAAQGIRKSQLITIPSGLVNFDSANDHEEFDHEENMDTVVAYLEEHPEIVADIDDGDVIQFLDMGGGYRNTGKLIYYEGEYYGLGCNPYDEYGYVPENININEFERADFFEDSVGHNYLIWHDHENYPVIKERTLPVDFNNNIDIFGRMRRVDFEGGWTLITNQDDIDEVPYTWNVDEPEFNLDMLPGHIDRAKLMYLINEIEEEENE